AGQEGGFLEDVLKRIANLVEHQEDLKSRVIGALAYPMFLAFAGFTVLNILIIFFVPRFEKIFEKLKEKGELPTLTTYLMSFSHFVQNYWWAVLGFAGTALYFFRRWAKSPHGRMVVDRVKIRLPLFGPVFLALALSRFCRILGTMLHNGIP